MSFPQAVLPLSFSGLLFLWAVLGTPVLPRAAEPPETRVPTAIVEGLAAGYAQEVIVLFDSRVAEEEATRLRKQAGLPYEPPVILARKAEQYAATKRDALAALDPGEHEVLRDYSHLPMVFLRLRTADALQRLMVRREVAAVFANEAYRKLLAESLPLINQPSVAAAGHVGMGTTVAVLDSGVDYTRPEFGSCPAPGVPGCKVVFAQDFTPTDDGRRDDPDLHGTRVSAIVLGVAPETRIAAIDVFRPDGSAWSSDINAAINWAIANRTTYNIAAINLSLGGTEKFTTPCSDSVFAVPLADARAAGILPAVASGNKGYVDGLVEPACAPAAVSVGAVYDANLGGLRWCLNDSCAATCTDWVTFADKVLCLSNSASYLTLLAPGYYIIAGGVTDDTGGTSLATPFVAGAIAVLRGVYPSETLDQTVARMTNTGVPVTDPRNGLTKPRLNLLAAVGNPAATNPQVTLSSNPGSYVAGDLFVLSATITPGTQNNQADGYVTVTIPGGGTYYLLPDFVNWSPTPAPVVANFTVVSFSGPIYSTIVPANLPAGSYAFSAFGVTPGSDPNNPANLRSNVGTLTVTLSSL